MSERMNNPERIYLEPPPYSPEGRQWCADDVWPLDGDGPGGVEYVRADLAALRSEVQGEGWQVTEPARDIVRREMPETRATVREAIRAARRGEGGE